MKHLIIRNIGPIKEADLELKRFNFIIGSQSSGKSTVAKILSTCEWIEKEVETTRNEQAIANGKDFCTLVENFHKMEDYFDRQKESYVQYKTDFIEILFEHHELKIRMNRDVEYNRQKICYIPSERNAVTLSELQGFEFGQTNLRSFLFDWFNAREFYKKDNKTEILDLGVTYYYDPDEMKNKDRIQHVNGETYDISLSNSSSGLQSVTPLIVMLQYYSDRYFNEYDFKNSFNQDNKVKLMRAALTKEVALSQYKPGFKDEEVSELVKQFNADLHKGDPQAQKIFEAYDQAIDRLLIPNRTTFIIEEPEQNLYPFTQIALTDAIVRLCSSGRKHGCTITTHSPFILNYLNVLIARFYSGVENKAVIDPMELGVFATGDGRLTDMMQINEKSGELSVNAEDLVEAMRYMYTEYREMKGK
jgi:predicted ATPase